MSLVIQQQIAAGKFHGIVRDLPSELYHAAPALSQSGLGEMEVSPAHYQASIFVPRKQTPAMWLGTMVDMAVLETEKFKRNFAVAPRKEVHPEVLDTVDQLKAKCASLGLPVSGAKAALITRIKEKDQDAKFWDEFLVQQMDGKEPIDPEDMAKIEGMADALLSHSFASSLFKLSESQVSGFTIDSETGLVRKGRADMIFERSGVIGDLKCSGIEGIFRDKRDMSKHLYDMRYHWQAAFYLDLFSDLYGKKFGHFANVFVHDKATMRIVKPGTFPKLTFPIVIPRLREPSLDLARSQYAPLVERFIECRKTGEWLGFPEGIQEVDVPDWAFSHGVV